MNGDPSTREGVIAATGARRKARRRRLLWAAALLSLLALAGFAASLDAYGQVERAQPADVIIILGARVMPDGNAGDSLRARALHAADLSRRGLAANLLCTGGVGRYPPAEAEAATALLRRQGIPAERILREERSTSTRENAANAAAICREHRWTRAIIVSDPYHLWRAARDFRAEGLLPYPSPALNCQRNRNPLLRVWWTLRESALVLRDLLRGA